MSWEEYFNHSFFKQDNDIEKVPVFNFNCNQHSQNLNYYCQNCKLNICKYCLNTHHNHTIIPFNDIGLNNEEIKKIENLFKEIEKRINILTQLKNNMQSFYKEMNSMKENTRIYENDEKNNYKKYYIDILEKVKNQLENNFNINFINLKSYYIC